MRKNKINAEGSKILTCGICRRISSPYDNKGMTFSKILGIVHISCFATGSANTTEYCPFCERAITPYSGLLSEAWNGYRYHKSCRAYFINSLKKRKEDRSTANKTRYHERH